MQLYSYYRSSCSYRVRIALHLLGFKFEYQAVNLLKAEHQSPAFTQLNPLQQVPVLVDGTKVLTQSLAILMYLDKLKGGGHLWPQGAGPIVHTLCEVINAGTQPLQNLALLNKLKHDFQATPEQIKQWNQHWILKGLEAFEKLLPQHEGPWALGEVSAVDCVLVPQVYNAARYGVDLSSVPRVAALYQQAQQHEAFQKAAPNAQIDSQIGS